MKKLISVIFLVVFVISTFFIGNAVGKVTANDDTRPEEVKKARKYEKTHKLQPIKEQTIDIYDAEGNYVITVTDKLYKKYSEKNTEFWKANKEKFIKKYNLPKTDPEGIIKDFKIKKQSKHSHVH